MRQQTLANLKSQDRTPGVICEGFSMENRDRRHLDNAILVDSLAFVSAMLGYHGALWFSLSWLGLHWSQWVTFSEHQESKSWNK
jgi:hypothetical protein